MSKIIIGDRVGRAGKIRCGVAAFIQNSAGEILLVRRSDNGRWCLPGGHVDPGESVAEACVREVFEETGLKIGISSLIGVYSSPDYLITYPDGNKAQFVSICLRGEILSGTLQSSSETPELGFHTKEQVQKLDVMETHVERITDGLLQKEAGFVR